MKQAHAQPPASRRFVRWALGCLVFAAALAQAQTQPPEAAASGVPDTIGQRATACTPCHGKEGRATNLGYFPRIAGKPEGYLYNQLVNFREGRRDYALMTYLVDQLTDDYLLELARYFASVDLPYPPPQTVNAPAELLARGRSLALEGDKPREIPACVRCHGEALTGVRPFVPGLLGLPRDYLIKQMGAWRTGVRHAASPDCMAKIAQGITPEEVAAVATWLSAQPMPADTHPAAPQPASKLPMRCGGLDVPLAGGTP